MGIPAGRPKWTLHPGELLREEFLRPMGLTPYALAKAIRVPLPRVNDIVREKRGLSADTALRLARFFGTSVEFWMNAQSFYEIQRASRRLTRTLRAIQPSRHRSVA
jgi:addiction module HigA family antidote